MTLLERSQLYWSIRLPEQHKHDLLVHEGNLNHTSTGYLTQSQLANTPLDGWNSIKGVRVDTYQDSGADTAEELDASETGVDVDDGTKFASETYIVIESEIMYVVSISSNTLTVVRGALGSTAATHTTDTDIYNLTDGYFCNLNSFEDLVYHENKFRSWNVSRPKMYFLDGKMYVKPFNTEDRLEVFYYKKPPSLWGSALSITAGAMATTAVTSFTASADASSLLSEGSVIKIDSEYMTVTSVVTTTVNVTRGSYGTTAATHGAASAIYLLTSLAITSEHFSDIVAHWTEYMWWKIDDDPKRAEMAQTEALNVWGAWMDDTTMTDDLQRDDDLSFDDRGDVWVETNFLAS